ncbi:MAG: DUF192 domain-containing protein [Elusimicrobiaceae bacterium]|nr:DUF192 domain-containing protein [Elusimicrobiaceae bacterium]
MKKVFFSTLIFIFLAGCSSYQTRTVTLPDGFKVAARVADTPAKQEKGLMFVTDLPENRGMLFVFDQEQELRFWMKNTLIDLDMVFIGADKKVTSVAQQVPHSYTYTPDYEVATADGVGQYVLELSAQTAAKHGVVPGATLQF